MNYKYVVICRKHLASFEWTIALAQASCGHLYMPGIDPILLPYTFIEVYEYKEICGLSFGTRTDTLSSYFKVHCKRRVPRFPRVPFFNTLTIRLALVLPLTLSPAPTPAPIAPNEVSC